MNKKLGFKVSVNPLCAKQMKKEHVSPLMAHRIVKRGEMNNQHPSGATAYTWNGHTVVGDHLEGEFIVFRYYGNEG